jgi:hypothetical protein
MNERQTHHLRWITSAKYRFFFGVMCIFVFVYTKISNVHVMNDDVYLSNNGVKNLEYITSLQIEYESIAPRTNCQIIYILGVEGSIHHGFTPILHSLALQQIDSNGNPFKVHLQPHALRVALFGRYNEKRSMDDPSLIHYTLEKLCPNDGRHHVIIEDASFPCGEVSNSRGYRFPRQSSWLSMTPNDIANSDTANNHPFNLHQFTSLYEPYATIKYVVLHRPFLETIASHADWDGGVGGHEGVIRGFMLILRRFLDLLDNGDGGRWTVVCMERLMERYYLYEGEDGVQDVNVDEWNAVRRTILTYLADFLEWSQNECDNCFDLWKEGQRGDKLKTLKNELMPLLDSMKEIEGVWPPVLRDGLPEQQCST